MNPLVAFVLGLVAGGGAVAAIGWHLVRTAREMARATEREELAAKQVAEDYVDQYGPRFVL